MTAFLVCRQCHVVFNPPSVPDRCPICHTHRADYSDEEMGLWKHVNVVDRSLMEAVVGE